MGNFRFFGAVGLIALAPALSAPAKAQVFDEIVVTATKRAESIQDVPVSVSAVSHERISSLGAVDFSALSIYLPNFEINNSTILPNLYVRGLGSGATHSIEQSVGRFVDEVYIGRGAMSIHGFFDIEGVEILRGPQGTLFGKNTVAGAMIVRTAPPTDEFESGAHLTYGGYSTQGNYQEVQGYVSGPLSDNLRSRLSVRYRMDEGYYINRRPQLGPSGPDRDDFGIRAKLEWDASDNTTVHVKLDHQIIDLTGTDAGEINAVGGPPFLIGNMQTISPGFNTNLDWVIDLDCTEVSSGERSFGRFCPGRDQETSTAVLRIDHDFAGLGTLTSLSAFQTYEFQHRFLGIDGGLGNAFRAYRDEDYDSFTQELRFTSDLMDDKYDFIVGAYYEKSDILRYQTSDVQFLTLGLNMLALQRNEPWSQDTETFAVFGQVRYNLADDLRLILGGRWSTETKDFVFDRFFHNYGTDDAYPANAPLGPFAPGVSVADDRSENEFTPAITLQYDMNDDVNVYAAYSQGHKTGGFSERIEGDASLLANPESLDFEFDPETNTSFELGLKGSFLDGRLNANFALFTMEVEGLQLATQLPGTVPAFSVDNAAEVTSEGIEFDAVFNIDAYWSIGVDYAYTDATYDTFDGAELDPCPGLTIPNPDIPGETLCELAGFDLNFAPKHKGNAFIEYFDDAAFGEWGAGFGINASYSDEYYTDISYVDSSFENGYTIIGANIRFVSPDEKSTVHFIGKNLTEEAVLQWGIPSGPNSLATLRAPREIAVKLNLKF